ncbi:MAG: rod shape-determining protein MreC [Candidatus Eisenbacteria bacterium]|uniref:Cell shape-determining protein MreC n=1 Tax=Eiseniibacteriota bacterium TaxID=2212470 RepID=A0A956RS55_UNCEI|nr:rod shape-determining protein MreC [Candidatus Eisenbacteria bacterium]
MSLPGGTAPRLRAWIGPAVAILASLTLLVLPESARRAAATALEHSVFAPFRLAVGWGEGSLALRLKLHGLLAEETEAHLEQDRVRETQQENERLRRLLGFERRTMEELVPGAVVIRDRGRLGDVLTVEVPPGTVVPNGAAAVVPEGLIGWATEQREQRVRVACLTNRDVTLSVLDQRTRDEGILGWVPPAIMHLELHDIPMRSEWEEGDRVITSGLGTVFPRGLLVGWVQGSEIDQTGRGKKVFVRPAASPAQTEELFFLIQRPDGSWIAQDGDAPAEAAEDASDLYPIDPAMESENGAGTSFEDPGVLPVP